ncbi:hypothetical protein COU95_00845 [Candidatus Shapirobacteria bacterium CG10_big_fil_rev_8_21_14_0_10_40_9]|uniref:Methyltransferase FkbM domain-containing protein n=1 Tax=Candidatus Shapirobacteria bacterium CG10_big_fil_rev_8_21_14_0_10_40_9 TaxID=1974888 RepID=A0A2M8L466_9BACT|nr:MAG: hypothetical protein COU95_00845 [Candidatus Shapirobacteria bacterium CG10_big_fil_rev_8_21_14_0_10_40_9]
MISLVTSTTIPNLIWWYKNCRNWQLRILEHLHLIHGDIIYKMRNGVNLKIRPYTDDADIIKEIYSQKPYTDNIALSSKPVVIDVGAHVGVFATLVGRNYPEAKIFCFEPSQNSFFYLKWNCDHNNGNFVLSNNAICGKTGKRKLFLDPQNPGHNSFYIKMNKGFELVLCKTLKSMVRENKLLKIDLLKLDCEGEEYEILLKLPSTLLSKIVNIVAEIHTFGSNRPEKICHFLKKNGFKVFIAKTNISSLYFLRAQK